MLKQAVREVRLRGALSTPTEYSAEMASTLGANPAKHCWGPVDGVKSWPLAIRCYLTFGGEWSRRMLEREMGDHGAPTILLASEVAAVLM